METTKVMMDLLVEKFAGVATVETFVRDDVLIIFPTDERFDPLGSIILSFCGDSCEVSYYSDGVLCEPRREVSSIYDELIQEELVDDLRVKWDTLNVPLKS